MRCSLDRTLRGFDFDRGAVNGRVGGEAVEIDQKLRAARDRDQLERVRCGLAARRDIAGYGVACSSWSWPSCANAGIKPNVAIRAAAPIADEKRMEGILRRLNGFAIVQSRTPKRRQRREERFRRRIGEVCEVRPDRGCRLCSSPEG